MRARNLKPSFFKNDILGTMPMAARLLFEGLWCMADREGRLEDRALRIKAEILPYDDVDVDDLLNQLQARKFIIRYAHGEDRYIQVVNFKRHQSPHLKEADSTIPAYDIPHAESALSGDMPPASTMQAPDSHRASPPESLNLNPDTPSRIPEDAAPSATASGEKPYDLFLAMCEVFTADPSTLAPAEVKRQCGIAKTLVEQGYTSDKVRRCTAYLRSESWRDRVDMRTVAKEIGSWEMNGEPERAKQRAAGANGPTTNGTPKRIDPASQTTPVLGPDPYTSGRFAQYVTKPTG